MELKVKYSDLWQEFLENLQTEKIVFGILDFAVNSIEIEWNLPKSNTDRWIQSLVVSDEHNHLFLADSLKIYCEELKKQCNLKCEEFWQNYEDNR